MDPFEYLTVFVSVILGLAVVHLLSGVSLILDKRIRGKVDWIHAVWTANDFLTTLLVWWVNFNLTAVQERTLLHFLDLVAYSVVLHLLSRAALPSKRRRGHRPPCSHSVPFHHTTSGGFVQRGTSSATRIGWHEVTPPISAVAEAMTTRWMPASRQANEHRRQGSWVVYSVASEGSVRP